MPRKRTYRVWGPDRHGRRWRVRCQRPDGEIDLVCFDSEAQARTFAEDARQENPAGLSVSQLADRYVADLERRGCVADDATRFLADFTAELGGIPIRDISRAQIERWYEKRSTQIAVRTGHEELAVIRRAFKHAVDLELLEENPAAKVRKIGKARRGKPQLTESEAATLYRFALDHAQDPRAAVTLLLLATGVRNGEATGIVVRDIDLTPHGPILWVRGTKTENARRRLTLPADVLAALQLHTRGKLPLARVFDCSPSVGQRRSWAYYAVKWACKRAGVPSICPQGARATWASIAEGVAAAPLAVCEALGHGGRAVTEAHYLRPGVADDARTARVVASIGTATSAMPVPASETIAKQSI